MKIPPATSSLEALSHHWLDRVVKRKGHRPQDRRGRRRRHSAVVVQSLRRLRPERLADRSAREGVAEVPLDEDLTGGGEDEEGLYHYAGQGNGRRWARGRVSISSEPVLCQ